MSIKVAENDFTRKMIDYTFTKIGANYVVKLGKLIVATGYEKLLKVQ